MGDADRERQETECVTELEEEHVARMHELEAEWNRKLEESDIDEDESKEDENQAFNESEEEWDGIHDEEEWTGIHDDEEVPLDEAVRSTMATTFEERMQSWDALLARIQKEGNESLDM